MVINTARVRRKGAAMQHILPGLTMSAVPYEYRSKKNETEDRLAVQVNVQLKTDRAGLNLGEELFLVRGRKNRRLICETVDAWKCEEQLGGDSESRQQRQEK